MNKILKLIQYLTPDNDKLAHFYWGNIYMIVGFLITKITGVNNLFIFLPVLLGLLKEIYDYKDYGGFSVKDWVYTSAPPILFLIIFHFLS